MPITEASADTPAEKRTKQKVVELETPAKKITKETKNDNSQQTPPRTATRSTRKTLVKQDKQDKQDDGEEAAEVIDAETAEIKTTLKSAKKPATEKKAIPKHVIESAPETPRRMSKRLHHLEPSPVMDITKVSTPRKREPKQPKAVEVEEPVQKEDLDETIAKTPEETKTSTPTDDAVLPSSTPKVSSTPLSAVRMKRKTTEDTSEKKPSSSTKKPKRAASPQPDAIPPTQNVASNEAEASIPIQDGTGGEAQEPEAPKPESSTKCIKEKKSKSSKKALKQKDGSDTAAVVPTSTAEPTTAITDAPPPRRKAYEPHSKFSEAELELIDPKDAKAMAAYMRTSKRFVIWIGSIPHGFYEEQMKAYFSQFGKVGRVRLSRSKKTGRSRGFAYVEFKDDTKQKLHQVAADVVSATHNMLLLGYIMKCKPIH